MVDDRIGDPVGDWDIYRQEWPDERQAVWPRGFDDEMFGMATFVTLERLQRRVEAVVPCLLTRTVKGRWAEEQTRNPGLSMTPRILYAFITWLHSEHYSASLRQQCVISKVRGLVTGRIRRVLCPCQWPWPDRFPVARRVRHLTD